MSIENNAFGMDLLEEQLAGKSVPFPPISRELLINIACAIRDAYYYICNKYPTTCAKGSEEHVTGLLQRRLNNTLDQNRKIDSFVSYFSLEGKVGDYKSESLGKRPDLQIILRDVEYTNFPLTVEAKIIDSKKRKYVSMYNNDGIKRYEKGEYAWYFQEGFMIAYVRDGSTISSKLHPKLKSQIEISGNTLPEQVGEFDGDLATSVHLRPFSYPLYPFNPLSPITLWHLWLPI